MGIAVGAAHVDVPPRAIPCTMLGLSLVHEQVLPWEAVRAPWSSELDTFLAFSTGRGASPFPDTSDANDLLGHKGLYRRQGDPRPSTPLRSCHSPAVLRAHLAHCCFFARCVLTALLLAHILTCAFACTQDSMEAPMANGRRGDGASGGSDWAPLLSDPPSPRAAASDPAARFPGCCVMLSDPELSDPAVGPPCWTPVVGPRYRTSAVSPHFRTPLSNTAVGLLCEPIAIPCIRMRHLCSRRES